MASPMPELAEHFPIELGVTGEGPADRDEVVSIACWCGKPECQEYLPELARLRPYFASESLMRENLRRLEK